MLKITYLEVLNEYVKLNYAREFFIELEVFNNILTNLSQHNLYCRFDYHDLENYANSIPDIAEVYATKIKFKPSQEWFKYLRLVSSDQQPLTQIIKDLLEKEI